MNFFNEDLEYYNQKIEEIYESNYCFDIESSDLDNNYLARLKVLAFIEKNTSAREEYEKIIEIKNLRKAEKLTLLDYDENGKLKLENFNISPESKIYVISKLMELKNFKKLFQLENIDGENVFKIHRLGIKNSEIVRLICDKRNPKFKNKLLTLYINEDGNKTLAINKLNLKSEEMKMLLYDSFSPDINIVENIIKDEYGDFGEEKLPLILVNSNLGVLREVLKNSELFEDKKALRDDLIETYRKIKNLKSYVDFEESNEKISIPQGMTVGVELETLGPVSNYLYGRLARGFMGEEDISIKDGKMNSVEIISPILTNENVANVLNFADKLRDLRQYTNQTCGGHIHIGSNYLMVTNDKKIDMTATRLSWRSFLEIWQRTEEIMYKISNGIGKEHRGIKFAKPIACKMFDMLEDETLKIGNRTNLLAMKKKIREIQLEDEPIITERNFSVNFDNLENDGKNTIEFRLPNGTLDREELGANIQLFASLMDVSRRLGIAKANELRDYRLTEEEQRILKLENELMSGKISEDEKAKILLNLLFEDDKKREVYTNRYNNSEFSIEEEIKKLNKGRTYDYSKYGEEVPVDELRKLSKCMRENDKNEIIPTEDVAGFNTEDMQELAEWNENENRTIFQSVIRNIRNIFFEARNRGRDQDRESR